MMCPRRLAALLCVGFAARAEVAAGVQDNETSNSMESTTLAEASTTSAESPTPATESTTSMTVVCVNRMANGEINNISGDGELWRDEPTKEDGGNTCDVYGTTSGWCSEYGSTDFGAGKASFYCCACGGGCLSTGCPTETTTTATTWTTTSCFDLTVDGAACQLGKAWDGYVAIISSARPGRQASGWFGTVMLAAAGGLHVAD